MKRFDKFGRIKRNNIIPKRNKISPNNIFSELPIPFWVAVAVLFIIGILNLGDSEDTNSVKKKSKSKIHQNTTGKLIRKNFVFGSSYIKYVVGEHEQKLLDGSPHHSEAVLSPNKKKIATIDSRDNINIINTDNTYHQAFKVKDNSWEGINNLIWVSNNKLRVYLEKRHPRVRYFKIGSFPLSESGTYELTIDDYNTLIAVDKFR